MIGVQLRVVGLQGAGSIRVGEPLPEDGYEKRY